MLSSLKSKTRFLRKSGKLLKILKLEHTLSCVCVKKEIGDLNGKWPQSLEFSRKLQMSGHSDIATVVGSVSSSVPGQKTSGRN